MSVVAERFIRTLKNKIYIYITSVPKNVYTDKLDDIVNKYNNTYHNTIKMKPADVKSTTYIDSQTLILAGDHARILKYCIKTFLQKVIFQIGQKKCL